MNPRTSRLALVLSAFMLGLVVFFGAIFLTTGRDSGAPTSSAIGGPFILTDQDGVTVTNVDVRGQPARVLFGYTHCPDVCPTTLFEVSEVLHALGSDAGKAQALFISIDPERDTPSVLKDYLSSFDPHLRGLTGTVAQITAAEKGYRVYAKKVPGTNGEYAMDHTALDYLMDKQGRFVAPFNLKRKPEDAAADLRKYF
jgi:protein SCO1/2